MIDLQGTGLAAGPAAPPVAVEHLEADGGPASPIKPGMEATTGPAPAHPAIPP